MKLSHIGGIALLMIGIWFLVAALRDKEVGYWRLYSQSQDLGTAIFSILLGLLLLLDRVEF